MKEQLISSETIKIAEERSVCVINKRRKMIPGYTEDEKHSFLEYVKSKFSDCSISVRNGSNLHSVHTDQVLVRSTEDDSFVHVITMGAGAYKMCNGARAEFMITLPAIWPIDPRNWMDENDYSPFRMLEDLARLPFTKRIAVEPFSILDNGNPFSRYTEQCACIYVPLDAPVVISEGKDVMIFQIIPIYRDEIPLFTKSPINSILVLLSNEEWYLFNPQRESFAPWIDCFAEKVDL